MDEQVAGRGGVHGVSLRGLRRGRVAGRRHHSLGGESAVGARRRLRALRDDRIRILFHDADPGAVTDLRRLVGDAGVAGEPDRGGGDGHLPLARASGAQDGTRRGIERAALTGPFDYGWLAAATRNVSVSRVAE